MSPSPTEIACFGAANLDRHARAQFPVVLGTSNPVTVSTAPGGVARNVAESLARLGRVVALVCRVGNDADGDRLVVQLTGLGVDMAAATRSSTHATASYTALAGPDGEMTVAMADMAIHDELTPAALEACLGELQRAPLWFADCNLPPDSLALLRRLKPPNAMLAADAVSLAKAERLGPDLSGVDLVFCNRDEATVLAGRTGSGAEAAAWAIRERGAGGVVISLGGDGVLCLDADECRVLPALAATVRDVTGAGDALVAGTLFGLSGGQPLAESVRLGLAAAALALETDGAVNDALTADALAARAGRPT